MKLDVNTPAVMPAPCGLYCGACYAHLRKKKTCPGCRGQEQAQPPYCRRCKIRDCAVSRGVDFCSECSSFPCALVKQIDKRYRHRYLLSLIENGVQIKHNGVEQFLLEQRQKWTCAHCGGVICLHDRICSECGEEMAQAA